MKFAGCTCVYCNNTFTETDDVVVCPVCGSPHHRSCWTENGSCTNRSLHLTDFAWVFPEELKPREEKKPTAPEVIETDYTFKNGENAVVCPHCKSLNYGNDAYCMRCRKPLFSEDEYKDIAPVQEPVQNGESSMPFRGNGFDYFQQFGGVRPDIMIDSIPVIEYADYIGEKKSGRYIRRFLNLERFGRKLSVSLCAFVFGPIWFFYRKLFKEGILYVLALVLLSGIMTWGGTTDYAKALYAEMGSMYDEFATGEISAAEMEEILLEKEEELRKQGISQQDKIKETVFTVAEVASLMLTLAMSFLADYLYKCKAKKDILAIREECSDMMTYRRTLHERGGTSTGGAVLGILAVFVISVIKLIPGYYYMFSHIL